MPSQFPRAWRRERPPAPRRRSRRAPPTTTRRTSFDAVGIGVLARGEAARRLPHLPEEVGEGLGRDAPVPSLARHLPRACRAAQAARCRRASSRSAARAIARRSSTARTRRPAGRRSPARHAVERRGHHRSGVRGAAHRHPERELQGHRLRELRRRSEPAPRRVEGATEGRDRVARDRVGERLRRSLEGGRLRDRVDDPAGLLLEVVAPSTPGLLDPLQELSERRHPVCRLLREVRPGEERPPLGREERRQRPAPLPGHRLDGVHVDRVEVGPFLAVDLDRHEVPIQVRGRLRVLEGLRSITWHQ